MSDQKVYTGDLGKSIGEPCPSCGEDKWQVIDETYLYKKICMNCFHIICIDKRDFVKNFECPECGSLSGKLEENDKKLGVRCNNCNKLFIKIEKRGVSEDRRGNHPQPNNIPRCPKCGSTQIQIVPRKWSLLAGFATRKTDRVCVNCKHRW